MTSCVERYLEYVASSTSSRGKGRCIFQARYSVQMCCVFRIMYLVGGCSPIWLILMIVRLADLTHARGESRTDRITFASGYLFISSCHRRHISSVVATYIMFPVRCASVLPCKQTTLTEHTHIKKMVMAIVSYYHHHTCASELTAQLSTVCWEMSYRIANDFILFETKQNYINFVLSLVEKCAHHGYHLDMA